MIDFESFVIPFQKSFWHNEKRWFVACEYNCRKSRYVKSPSVMLLYTMPNIYGVYYSELYSLRHGILFRRDNYYITEYSGNHRMNSTACNVSSQASV